MVLASMQSLLRQCRQNIFVLSEPFKKHMPMMTLADMFSLPVFNDGNREERIFLRVQLYSCTLMTARCLAATGVLEEQYHSRRKVLCTNVSNKL